MQMLHQDRCFLIRKTMYMPNNFQRVVVRVMPWTPQALIRFLFNRSCMVFDELPREGISKAVAVGSDG